MAARARCWIVVIEVCNTATAFSRPCECAGAASGSWNFISIGSARAAGGSISPVRSACCLSAKLARIAATRGEGILKLIVTRGSGSRGYRPSGRERCTRIIALHPLPRRLITEESRAVRLRVCATPLAVNARLAGLKTLNRLDCVLARAEWQDTRIWDGLMQDGDGNWVSGTMSNLFLKRGSVLMTPLLDRCGVAGVMRRWILERAAELRLRPVQRPIRWDDLKSAEEVFMSNAVVGIRAVRAIEWARKATLRFSCVDTANRLRALLDTQ